jgi:thioredoxin reductase
VLERHRVGASFDAWPEETRFITPSFPSNSAGTLDLNSVAIGVSPAFSIEVEHPNGKQFAEHLRQVAKHFEVPVREATSVVDMNKVDGSFRVSVRETIGQTSHPTEAATQDGTRHLKAKHVVWAAGEYQYPKSEGFFPGSEHCRHTSTVQSFATLPGDDHIVIGGYESGVDAAFHLAKAGKGVRVFDSGCPWKVDTSDPSVSLSTYSLERVASSTFQQNVELFPRRPIRRVVKLPDDSFEVTTKTGRSFTSSQPPLLAIGFKGSHHLVGRFFERRPDGFPLLNEDDESTLTPGLFLAGPAVRQGKLIFCFLYKYRQRFAVVAKAIAEYLGHRAEALEEYRSWGMWLDNLSSCGQECVC